MDYTRHSSQPATVDLVRADLAEIWTIDDSDVDSPKRPPPVSSFSDMLDLEFIPTPGLRPSKAMRKDPLPDLLGDLLELSPSRNGKGNDLKEKRSPNESGNTKNYRGLPAEQPDNRSNQVSVPANKLLAPTKLSSSPRESHHRSRVTQKSTQSTHLKKSLTNASKSVHSKPQTEGAGTPVSSPAPSRRRQRESNGKPSASSSPRKRPTKESKQAKILPETTKPTSTRSKTRTTKRDDDAFELSDVTDTEEGSRPKKRQSKPPAPKEPSASSGPKSAAAGKGNVQSGPAVSQRSKPTRVPKKASGAKASYVPSGSKARIEPTSPDAIVHADQKMELDVDPGQDENKNKRARNKHSSPGSLPVSDPTPEGPKIRIPRELASPEPPRDLAVASEENSPVLPAAPEPRDIINMFKGGLEDGGALAGSTSPLFVEQHEHHATSDGQDIAVTVKPFIEIDQRLPVRSPVDHSPLGWSPPPSFQPQAFAKHASMSQEHDATHQLPTTLRDAFLSDEQPTSPPSLAPQLECSSEEESVSPEDVWKQVVEDSSPPAVMHRIVTLLHRSLKPKEEVVRDIAADYHENALRLLDNLSARHRQEKADTMAALRKAFREAFSLFGGAGQDMAVLVNKLRDMDVTHAADTLTRPGLAHKLDAVSQLCQLRLSAHTRDGAVGGGPERDMEDVSDALSEMYRLKLLEAVGRSGDTQEASNTVESEVEDFVKRSLQGETKKVHRAKVDKPKEAARNADDALEVFLDGIMSTFQEKTERRGTVQAETVIDTVSEDSDMADLDV